MAWRIRVHGNFLFHHIYAWGNDRHPVFKDEHHYQEYLKLLKQYSNKYSVDVISYALMHWHVHLFIHDPEDCVSDFMMNLHGSYAQFYNRTTGHIGHVFGERYNNKIVIPNIYGMWLSRYIHRQALDANLVTDPIDYPWTSYHVYIDKIKQSYIKPDIIMDQFGDKNNRVNAYIDFVEANNEGPIDWNAKVLTLRPKEEFIKFICDQHVTSESVLLNPKGAIERNERHGIIIKLNNIYGLNGSQISHLLNMSRSTVWDIMHQ
jgi:putative transposase